MAFEWNGEKQDNDDIYLKLVGSSELRRLTTDALPEDTPAWSPDGREIAFVRRGQGRTTVHAVSPVTGAERKIRILGAGALDGPVLVTRRSMAGNRPWHPVEGRQPPAGPRPGRRAAHADHDEGLHRLSFVLAGRAGARVQDVPGPIHCSLDVLALDAAFMPAGAARTVAPVVSLYDLVWAAAWTRDGRSLIYESGRYLWRVPVAETAHPNDLNWPAAVRSARRWPPIAIGSRSCLNGARPVNTRSTHPHLATGAGVVLPRHRGEFLPRRAAARLQLDAGG